VKRRLAGRSWVEEGSCSSPFIDGFAGNGGETGGIDDETRRTNGGTGEVNGETRGTDGKAGGINGDAGRIDGETGGTGGEAGAIIVGGAGGLAGKTLDGFEDPSSICLLSSLT
jgi:hypothetical protein